MGADRDDDERRWAEALALLARTADEPAEQRLRDARRRRLVTVSVLLLTGTAAATVLALLLLDRTGTTAAGEVPTWRAAVGYSTSGLGLVGLVAGVVVQLRDTRRARGWRSPLHVLTRRQRKTLLAEVRGRVPADPVRVPLARHLAGLLLLQRTALVAQVGMTVSQLGLWIAEPRTWRLVLAGVLGAVQAAALLVGAREWRRARRFLDAHLAPERPVP